MLDIDNPEGVSSMQSSEAGTKRIRITRIREGTREGLSDIVVRESPLTIFLNDVELATFMCSPVDLQQLAVGFLYTEGVISSREDIKAIAADEREGVVWVNTKGKRIKASRLLSRRLITTGCGRGLSFHDLASGGKSISVRSRITVSPDELSTLMRVFQQRSELYRRTGGVHSAALCDRSKILVLKEDVGRHNAIDKVVGECVMRTLDMRDRILATSGRISSEMLIKAARANIPIVLSKSAPTDLGVSLARDFGITLIGFARGARMNVYSNVQRVSKVRRQSVSTGQK